MKDERARTKRWRWGLMIGWAALGLCSACAPATAKKSASAREVVQKKAGQGPRVHWLEQAKAQERAGDRRAALASYERAEAHGHAAVPRARLLLELGQYEEVWETFRAAREPELILASARALQLLGRVQEARHHLEPLLVRAPAGDAPACAALGTHADQYAGARARALSGELALELGERALSDATWEPLLACAQAGQSLGLEPGVYVYAGRAAAWGRKYELANELYNHAELQLDPTRDPVTHRDLLLHRAALFLEKHDQKEAQSIGEELNQAWPHDLGVQLYVARLLADTQFDFAQAERMALAILEVNPRHAGALFLLAGIELYDMRLERAAAYVERGLSTNPRDLDLLSLRATIRYLREDKPGFEAELDHILELSPGNVRPYLVFAEHAEWEHRYPDLEKYMRRAARLDPQAAQVRSRLGLTLVRAASDAAGVVELNRAYDLDPYDVRVINTLHLYEKIIPRDYVSLSRGPFRYRFPKAEAALLERYVPALLDAAYEQMVERYGYTPPTPIDIELYEDSQQFAVRTSGVPSVGIQGVCFGRKLATVTPVGSPGNLGMTLWHELGHVFHIGLSQYRVPRYLTEGLAEWETASRDVGWSREMDRELFEVQSEGRLPPLSQMSRAFTHAESARDVAAAYYASGLLSEWWVERFGQPSMVQVLRELGQGQLAKEVIPRVLGSSWPSLDQAFSAHLTQKLRPIAAEFTPARARASSTELRPQIKKQPGDVKLQVQLILALLEEGKVDEAKGLLVAGPADDPQYRFLRVRLALAEEDHTRARRELDALLGAGADGYALRMLSARLYQAEKKPELAVPELERALDFDPSSIDVRQMLVDHYRAQGQTDAELAHVRAWAQLSEHDPRVHQRLVELLLEQDQPAEAVRAARLLLWVDLAGVETHRLAGLAMSRAGSWKDAEFEWESALLCPADPDQLVRLGHTWTQELARSGRGARAPAVERRIAAAVQAALATRLDQTEP